MRSRTAALATFLVVLSTTTAPPPARAGVNSFIDDDTSRFEPFIETAWANGLVTPCNPPANNRVCPSDPVTLGTMVLMLARAVGQDQPSMDHFVKKDGTLGELALSTLTEARVDTGCQAGEPCMDRPISRGEMASLFSVAFQWKDAPSDDAYVDTGGSAFGAESDALASRGGLLTCDAPVDTRLCPGARVRRDEAIFALVSVLGLHPATTKPRQDPAPLGFSDSFDTLSLWDGRTPSYRNRVSLTNAGYQGSGLRVEIPTGSHFGADFHLRLQDTASGELDQLYFRYYLKLDPDWQTASSGKLPGFSGVYGSSGKGGYPSRPGDPGWSARLMFSPARGEDPRVQLGYYVYHLGQETQYGDGVGWNEAGKLQPGEWYCLEGEVEMNTLGVADGALRAWVDGTPALDFSGLEFRRPDESAISIKSFWFDVYYGGKQLSDHDLGMTFDEVAVDTHRVGCGSSKKMRPVTGDFNGDGLADSAWWVGCPEGTCLRVESGSSTDNVATRTMRDNAWFSVESRRLGMGAGDIDGDGRDEIVYRGRCDDSVRCWRVHTDPLDQTAAIENWGDAGRFSTLSSSITLGDWNGDGLDDLAYQGVCGMDKHGCWRVHLSNGEHFEVPQDWGPTPASAVAATAADLDGDGREDLVYRAPCDEGTCWFTQRSKGKSFAAIRNLGPTTDAEDNHFELIDYDSSGTSDLMAWTSGERGTRVEVRYLAGRSLSHPVLLARVDRPVSNVMLFRTGKSAPVAVVMDTKCGDGSPCRQRLFATSSTSLGDADGYRALALERLGLPAID